MPKSWLLIFACVLLWSGINPHDRFTWWLEIAPALIALPILWVTQRRFPLTPLAAWFLLFEFIILMIGGHYTYAEVPLFDWIRDTLGQTRNNYDKLGHFCQGFIPALVIREILIRKNIVQGKGWLFYLVTSCCLAFSAFYELIEWLVSELTGSGGDAFLGTQGYVWDTQSDMAMALIGAMAAQLLLGKYHDRQIKRLTPPLPKP